MRCPDCQGELELQEDGNVVTMERRPWLRWVPDHTDAVCLDCGAVFRIDLNGRIRRNEIERPLDELLSGRPA